ncbi:MAG: hypothetical protein ACRCVG_07420 [Methanobacteriaceae archaeon]
MIKNLKEYRKTSFKRLNENISPEEEIKIEKELKKFRKENPEIMYQLRIDKWANMPNGYKND